MLYDHFNLLSVGNASIYLLIFSLCIDFIHNICAAVTFLFEICVLQSSTADDDDDETVTYYSVGL